MRRSGVRTRDQKAAVDVGLGGKDVGAGVVEQELAGVGRLDLQRGA